MVKEGNKKYYPLLDSFRGVAVLFILLYHSNFIFFKNLWIGVPMFFVLSGFLITEILLISKNSENYFKVFYFRRCLRIFPIYYITLLFLLILSIFIKWNTTQLLYYLFYIQSILISTNTMPIFCNGIMEHSWSLSVEEMFYFIWPLIVYYTNKDCLFRTILILLLFSFSFKLYQLFYGTEGMAFLSFFGAVDSLMIGAILAYNFIYKNGIKKSSTILIGTTTLIWFGSFILLYLTKTDFNSFVLKISLYTSTMVLSFYFIAFCTNFKIETLKKSTIYKLINGTGKISYGLYLYHYIVYMLIDSLAYHYKITFHLYLLFMLKIFITFLISFISWRLFEKPLLQLKKKMVY